MTPAKSLIASLAGSAALIATAAIAQPDAGGRPFTVTMTGAAEVPGPGDPDGTGTARITINPGKLQACYDITVANLDDITAAHIHRTPPDPGPAVVPLFAFSPPTDDTHFEDCVAISSRELAMEIIRNPSIFYVNVHTDDFPAGAIRAQLAK